MEISTGASHPTYLSHIPPTFLTSLSLMFGIIMSVGGGAIPRAGEKVLVGEVRFVRKKKQEAAAQNQQW